MEPIVNLLLLLLGAVLVLRGFRKEPKDKTEGFVGILIVLLTGFQWVMDTQEWFKQQPRTISPPVHDAMVEMLREYSGQSVHLGYVSNDNEAYEFAQQLKKVLARAGWNIQESIQIGGAGSPVGVELRVPTDEITEPVLALSAALRAAGITFTRGRSTMPPPGEPSKEWIWVEVGKRKD